MDQPVIQIISDPALGKKQWHENRHVRFGMLTPKIGDTLAIARYDAKNLAVVLHNKLAQTDAMLRRGNWFGGRIYNKLMGEDGGYVQLNGVHLKQVFPLTGYDLPIKLHPRGEYLLRRDMVEAALAHLQKS